MSETPVPLYVVDLCADPGELERRLNQLSGEGWTPFQCLSLRSGTLRPGLPPEAYAADIRTRAIVEFAIVAVKYIARERVETLLDVRVPQPGELDELGVPARIQQAVEVLHERRNVAPDTDVPHIDGAILSLLSRWIRQ
jgi:hypothetical protein